MKCSCTKDVAFALVFNGKVRRLTFSQNLAEYIQGKNPDHEIWLLDLIVLGEAKEDTKDCIFGIVSSRNGKVLRATVSFEEARYLTQDPTRWIGRCKVRKARPFRRPLLPTREDGTGTLHRPSQPR